MSVEGKSRFPYAGKRKPLIKAISGSLAATCSASAAAQTTQDQAPQNNALEEVIVTARKREENIQDIPQSIQAFSQADIDRAGIVTLQDVAKFVPALTVVGQGSGLNKIVFRGLADSIRPFIADSSAAIYLDEQPLTTGTQSPEIRPIDLERIETLAGPQGTLYGASSQSGTIRYIVAKPDAGAFDANVGGGIHSIDQGGTGWDVDAMLNIPVVQDKFAIRIVGFAAEDAGYIDNVYGNSPGRVDADTGEHIPGSKNNAAFVGANVNSGDWVGGRISARLHVNDNWSVTGIYNYSDAEIHGYSDYDPTTGDLKTILFTNEIWDDQWSNFQLTLDGDLGFAQMTSSLAYFERDTAYVFDGTSEVAYYHSVLGYYGRGSCGSNPYYAAYNVYDFATSCELNGTGYDFDDGDPTGRFRNDQRDTRWTFETRLSGSTSRWDWTVGFFYQDADQHWDYGTYVDGLTRTDAWEALQYLYGPTAPTDVRWQSGEISTREDIAVFGETTLSLSDQWKLLLGARWYDTEIDRYYYQSTPAGAPLNISQPTGSDDGWLPKLGFQYFFEDDRMAYALYSEGFRTGGINRARGNPTLPILYQPDLLKNWEGGLKTRWMDGRVQFNLIGYHQVWEDMQLELTDPSSAYGEPYQTVIANVGDANVDGADLELTYLPSNNWSLGVIATYLFEAEIDEDIKVFDDRDPDDLALDIPAGTRLPLVADFNLSAYAEYSWPVGWADNGEAFVRLQASHTGGTINRLVDADSAGNGYGRRTEAPSYDIWDLRAGLSSANWEFTAFVDNLADERAVVYHDTNADVFWGRDNYRILKPRTYGINLRRHFK